MRSEQKANPLSKRDIFVLVGSVGFSLALLLSHWFYINNIHHRIGGVAWNSLFQIFGNPLAGFVSIGLLVKAITADISRWVGVVSALLLASTAGYCFFQSMKIMISI